MIATAATQMPGLETISVALPASNAPRVVLTLDSGDGGQPQKRATLTLDGAPVRPSDGSRSRASRRGARRARGCASRTPARSTVWRGRRSRGSSRPAAPFSCGPGWRSRCAASLGGADDSSRTPVESCVKAKPVRLRAHHAQARHVSDGIHQGTVRRPSEVDRRGHE